MDCKLNINHHLGIAQRETPYWDYKQKYDLQDTERNLSAQLSTHNSSDNLSPLVGNTLGETRTNLRESRSGEKNDQRLRNTAYEKRRRKKNGEFNLLSRLW